MIRSGEVFRTPVENLFMEEMIEEDANYLIMGDNDEDIEAVIPQNYNDGGIFDSASSEEDIMSEDDDDDIFEAE